MRRQLIALAAAACLTATACATTDPGQTPDPTPAEVTTTVGTSEPATSESPVGETESPEPSSSEPSSPEPSATDSETADDATERDVDLATHAFALTPQQAIAKGTAEAGDGIVHSIELDWSQHHDAWVYELDILVGNIDHDIDLDADTGEILDHDRDDTDDKEQVINLDSPMNWETARDKALDAVQGRITSWKLEWDDDYTSYEFDIEDSSGDETEVEINVDTGAVKIDD